MGTHFGHNSVLDRSHLFYYEKAPLDEDETRQPSSAEDISTGLIEDLAYLIYGNENINRQPCASDIQVKDSKFSTTDVDIARLTHSPRSQ